MPKITAEKKAKITKLAKTLVLKFAIVDAEVLRRCLAAHGHKVSSEVSAAILAKIFEPFTTNKYNLRAWLCLKMLSTVKRATDIKDLATGSRAINELLNEIHVPDSGDEFNWEDARKSLNGGEDESEDE